VLQDSRYVCERILFLIGWMLGDVICEVLPLHVVMLFCRLTFAMWNDRVCLLAVDLGTRVGLRLFLLQAGLWEWSRDKTVDSQSFRIIGTSCTFGGYLPCLVGVRKLAKPSCILCMNMY